MDETTIRLAPKGILDFLIIGVMIQQKSNKDLSLKAELTVIHKCRNGTRPLRIQGEVRADPFY